MKLWHTIKYWFCRLFKRQKNPLHSYVDDWANPTLTQQIWDKIAGFFYNWGEEKLEQYKIWRWGKSKDATEEKIIFEVASKSKKRLVNFMLIFLGLSGLDFILQTILSSKIGGILSESYTPFIQSFLVVIIGTISGFIALIFSLYGVVVQIVMQKYSTSVTKFINEDKFPNFFLRSLIFIDLLAIFLYLRGELLPTIPIVVSFLFLLLSIIYTMIALILLKDSYSYSIKPENLFIRLGTEVCEQIRIAAGYDKTVRNSRSVIHYSGKRTRELFEVFASLFDDLLREKNFKDISKAPATLAFIFVEYLEKRKFIEDEQGWWFPKQFKLMKGDSMTSYAIKANYEIQGKGVLHMQVRNKEWFEQRTRELLDLMTRNIPIVNEDAYTRAVISAYNVILVGQPTKNKYDQYDSKIRGAYENGEIEVFKWFYEEFSKLAHILNLESENVSAEFLNTLFAIGLVLMEENEEVLSTVEEFLKSVVSEGQINATSDDLKKLNLPKNAHNLVCELLRGLKAEVTCEGMVVTPTSSFIQEISDKLKNKYLKDADDLLTRIFTDVDKLIHEQLEKKSYALCLSLIELEIRWFQKLTYLEKFELATKHGEVLSNAYKYILKIPVEDIQKVDLLDALELLIFPIAVANKKDLFSPLSAILVFLLIGVYRPQQQTPEEQLLLMRTLVVLGGFLYLVGEFEEDFSLLEVYSANLHIVYPNPATTLKALENLKNISGITLSGRIISREVTRYHHWFSVMHGRINALPKTWHQTRIYAGMSEAADHPSNFIKEMSVGLLFDEDECIKRFIEWLKNKYPEDTLQDQEKEDINGHSEEAKEGATDVENNTPEEANQGKNG